MTDILGVTARELDGWHERGFVSSTSEAPDQSFYTFADVVCLKSAELLTSKGVSDRLICQLLDRLRSKLIELDEHLTHRSVSIFQDRVVLTSKNHFVDSRAGQALGRIDLDELIEKIIARVPSGSPSKTAEEWLAEGLTEMSRPGGEDTALACFSEVLKSCPSRADVYLNIGKIHYRQRRLLDAERSLRLAVQRDPYNPEVYSTLGRTMEEQQRLEEAIVCYEKALQIDPTLKKAHYQIGRACVKADLWDRALRHWNCYLLLDPDSANAESLRRQIRLLSEARLAVDA